MSTTWMFDLGPEVGTALPRQQPFASLIGLTDTRRSTLDFPKERQPPSASYPSSSNASSILPGRASPSSTTLLETTGGNNIVILPWDHLALWYECRISWRKSVANLCAPCRNEIYQCREDLSCLKTKYCYKLLFLSCFFNTFLFRGYLYIISWPKFSNSIE